MSGESYIDRSLETIFARAKGNLRRLNGSLGDAKIKSHPENFNYQGEDSTSPLRKYLSLKGHQPTCDDNEKENYGVSIVKRPCYSAQPLMENLSRSRRESLMALPMAIEKISRRLISESFTTMKEIDHIIFGRPEYLTFTSTFTGEDKNHSAILVKMCRLRSKYELIKQLSMLLEWRRRAKLCKDNERLRLHAAKRLILSIESCEKGKLSWAFNTWSRNTCTPTVQHEGDKPMGAILLNAILSKATLKRKGGVFSDLRVNRCRRRMTMQQEKALEYQRHKNNMEKMSLEAQYQSQMEQLRMELAETRRTVKDLSSSQIYSSSKASMKRSRLNESEQVPAAIEEATENFMTHIRRNLYKVYSADGAEEFRALTKSLIVDLWLTACDASAE
eukprot:TRINITY_DN11769_c0_g1_i1.p1 TRINITY_DN11769_c0_g1~~TRINITY_DN11769_c0_g1_i1.p1  ORF type:complete len:389 (-),score=63.45 TRINITY_DN11769_c0_g1_i1:809-1975(-)